MHWSSNTIYLITNKISHSLLSSICSSVLWCCWLDGRKSIQPVKKLEWWGAGMVICLERGANDLHMVQLMQLSPYHLCFRKILSGLSFWYRPSWVVLEKRQLNNCVFASIYRCVWQWHVITVTVMFSHDFRPLRPFWLFTVHLHKRSSGSKL